MFISIIPTPESKLGLKHPLGATSFYGKLALVTIGSAGVATVAVKSALAAKTAVITTGAAAGTIGTSAIVGPSAITGGTLLASQLGQQAIKGGTTLGLGAMLLNFIKDNPLITFGIAGIIGAIIVLKRR